MPGVRTRHPPWVNPPSRTVSGDGGLPARRRRTGRTIAAEPLDHLPGRSVTEPADRVTSIEFRESEACPSLLSREPPLTSWVTT